MTNLLHGQEVVEIGLRIETNGRNFYLKAAAMAKSADVRSLFEFLADQERIHIEHFAAVMRSGGSYSPPEAIAEEQMAYIKALGDMSIFTPAFPPERAAIEAGTPEAALGIAINVEKDSILFYRNIEDFVPQKEGETVRELRRQEEMHLRLITEKLRELKAKAV